MFTFCSKRYQDLAYLQFTSNVQNDVPLFECMPESLPPLIDGLVNNGLTEV